MTLRDRVPNAVVPRRSDDVRETEFWVFIGGGAVLFTALVIVLNAVAVPTVAVLTVGVLFGWLTNEWARRTQDQIDAKKDDAAAVEGGDRRAA